jgi:Family of unknown function (DUF5519)
MGYLSEFQDQVSAWPGVSTQPHRFGGTEFCFGSAELGPIHPDGILDIPLTRAIHDVLLEEGLAERHRWLPDSGWVTFHMRSENDLRHGPWLARVSYFRYALKVHHDPRTLFERECESLQLDSRLAGLLEKFVPTLRQAAGA